MDDRRFNCWLDGAITRFNYHNEQINNEEKQARQSFDDDKILQIRVLKALCRYRRVPQGHPRRQTITGELEFGALTAFHAFFGRDGSILRNIGIIAEFIDYGPLELTKQDGLMLKIIVEERSRERSAIDMLDDTFFDEIILRWFDGEDVLIAKLRTHIDRLIIYR
jgi:hypothetical protein